MKSSWPRAAHLTPAGEAAFLRWVRSPVEHGREVQLEFLAKLYFARQESPVAALELTALQRQMSSERLNTLKREAAALEAEQSYDWLGLRYRLGQLQALLDWLGLCVGWLQTAETTLPPS